jgi:S-adenosylmethionine-dependent methyltransferase
VSNGQRVEQRAEVGRAPRAALVDDILVQALGPQPASASVLDCGGGTGRFAVPLAVAGATVSVLDISADALATLRRRASEAGVADRVRAVQGDAEALSEALSEALPGEQFDLVLAHGILDAIDDWTATFADLVATVRPGGLLSLLVGNPVAAVLARVLAGDLAGAERDVAALDDGAAATPGRVRQLCAAHGLTVEQEHGIGIFRDLVPGRALDLPGSRDALDRLEAQCAQRSPFAQIAGRVHLLARR